MSAKFKVGLMFAALGYAVPVALYGIASAHVHVTPRPVLYTCLAPTLAFFATEDVYLRHVLLLLAPINALIYCGVAVGFTALLQYLLEGHQKRTVSD
jgi:hypothetical protein